MSTTPQSLQAHDTDVHRNHTPSSSYQIRLGSCIEACTACAQACTTCIDDRLSDNMDYQLRGCISADLDCADICSTTALPHRGRGLSRTALQPRVTQLKATWIGRPSRLFPRSTAVVGRSPFAGAGLLDGRDATTHWLAADAFAARHPAVRLNPEVLYTDNGNILTSAGAASGFDLCLHFVERDYGTAVVADAARLAVAPLHRPRGQVLYIVRNRPTSPAARGSRVNAVGNRPRRLP